MSTSEAPKFQAVKSYFRNDPRFGRTTTLLLNGQPVFEAMGACSKRDLVRGYEAQQAR